MERAASHSGRPLYPAATSSPVHFRNIIRLEAEKSTVQDHANRSKVARQIRSRVKSIAQIPSCQLRWASASRNRPPVLNLFRGAKSSPHPPNSLHDRRFVFARPRQPHVLPRAREPSRPAAREGRRLVAPAYLISRNRSREQR